MKEGDKPEGIRDICQVKTCFKQNSAENWTNQNASGTYVVRREDVSKRILECFLERQPLSP